MMAAIKKNTNLTMEEKISIFEYKEKNNSASFADIRQGVHEYDQMTGSIEEIQQVFLK